MKTKIFHKVLMVSALTVLCSLVAFPCWARTAATGGVKLPGGSSVTTLDHYGFSVAVDGSVAVVGAPYDDVAGTSSGSVYIFQRSSGVWQRVQTLRAHDEPNDLEQFGRSVALDTSAGILVVGAPYEDSGADPNRGAAFVYKCGYELVGNQGRDRIFQCERFPGSQYKLEARSGADYDGHDADRFGWSVAVEGDTIVVGAENAFANSTRGGAAYVYSIADLEQGDEIAQKLISNAPESGASFGRSVAVDGNTIVVGEPFSNAGAGVNNGKAHFFKKGSGSWSRYTGTPIVAPDDTIADHFGTSVAVDGIYAIVGAPGYDQSGDDNQGRAYIFERTNGAWSAPQKLDAPGDLLHGQIPEADHFGAAVDIKGSVAIVGAPQLTDYGFGASALVGAAYLYFKNPCTTDWQKSDQIMTPTAYTRTPGDNFGSAVALGSNYAVVGAKDFDDGRINTGAAFAFAVQVIDRDNDGLPDAYDNCPTRYEKDPGCSQPDYDGDGVGDLCDNCPGKPNPPPALDVFSTGEQSDLDDDGFGEVCDNCDIIFNPDQINTDGDSAGDACDPDDDGDGWPDILDSCPLDPDKASSAGQCGCGVAETNTDNDLLPDCIDGCPLDQLNDIDRDTICGDVDNCPIDYNPGQEDADDDGLGDACDPQTCGNGVLQTGEECDDGNTTSGDGCSETCTIECIPSPEVCDGVDNDCDGAIDEGLSTDADGDGHYTIGSCFGPADDCDDTNPMSYPGYQEACDGVDNDCNGQIDDGLSTDADGDGHYLPGSCFRPADDCDDANPDIYTGNPEVCDGLDNDCNGQVDDGLSTDADGDGHYLPGSCFGPDDDCDDANPASYPGNPEVCDGVDNNCDGQIDEGDVTPPQINCPADIVVSNDAGACGAAVSYTIPTASDECTEATIARTGGLGSGASYPTGTNIEMYTATDRAGNKASCSFVVTVVDDEAPVIACPADVVVECDQPTDPASTGQAAVVDNCDSPPTIAFNDAIEGSYPTAITRTWTATDQQGNQSSCEQVISVVDTTPPVLQGVPADATVECDNIPAPVEVTATDGCSADILVSFSEISDGQSCPRTITRTWTATDDAGNSVSSSQTITVDDTTPPILTTLASPLTVECDGLGNTAELDPWLLNSGGAAANDNCGFLSWSYNVPGLPEGPETTGAELVTFVAEDTCGNSSTTTAQFEIIDTTSPTITVPPDKTVECTGQAGTAVNIGQATASDVCCGVTNVSNDAPANFSLGTTAVNWTSTDCNGLNTTQTQEVVVRDTTPPTVTAKLIRLGSGDEWDDEDEGRFVVDFQANDVCDSSIKRSAVLLIGRNPRRIEVNNGQTIEFEMEDDETEVEKEGSILEIEAPSLILEVTATDASGNTSVATARPILLGADNDGPGDDDD